MHICANTHTHAHTQACFSFLQSVCSFLSLLACATVSLTAGHHAVPHDFQTCISACAVVNRARSLCGFLTSLWYEVDRWPTCSLSHTHTHNDTWLTSNHHPLPPPLIPFAFLAVSVTKGLIGCIAGGGRGAPLEAHRWSGWNRWCRNDGRARVRRESARHGTSTRPSLAPLSCQASMPSVWLL